jgi:DNA helicase-2/ATP-dependent DNA helicase PcrA
MFRGVEGPLRSQADYVMSHLIPELHDAGICLEGIGILYRTAKQGDELAAAAIAVGIPVIRSDNRALIPRNNPLARWIESCAAWVAGGWMTATPPFHRLVDGALSLACGAGPSNNEAQKLQLGLAEFLTGSRDRTASVNTWLRAFRDELLADWMSLPRANTTDWSALDVMISRTDPESTEGDMSLAHFAGRLEGSGRLTLSTLHSAKGREFDAVVMFAMNDDVIPGYWDLKKPEALREARRLFYVGVTRARKYLVLVFQGGHPSPWVAELEGRASSE